MGTPGMDLILYEEDEARLTAVLRNLCEASRSRAAFLTDRNGRLLAAAGETAGVDTTSLASLAAGSIAAAGGLGQLLGEEGCRGFFLEGQAEHLLVSVVQARLILLVRFDRRTVLGLVRHRVRGAAEEIGRLMTDSAQRNSGDPDQRQAALRANLAQITDEEIDNLFAN